MQTAANNTQAANAVGHADPRETVLVVEDSKVERERLHAMLKGLGYRTLTADDGAQALELLRLRRVGLILTDWHMPAMSGIELCRAIRADPAFGQPYLILVTGRNTTSDLVAGMEAGADDFITKPFNREELRVRVQAGVRLLQLRGEAEQRNRELAAALAREAAANRLIRDDLTLAARMQRASLPTTASPFPQIAIGSLFDPAVGVAGDSYGHFPLDDRHLAFYLIDVAGHGVAAAMLSFALSRLLAPETGVITLRHEEVDGRTGHSRHLGANIVPPHRVAAALNRRFLDTIDVAHYFTMIYGVLDVESGHGELCQAGHPHPLLVHDSQRVRRLGKGGFPVGMLEQADYEPFAFQLDIGERLVVYSDGVTDCLAADGRRLGEQRLANLLGPVNDQPLTGAVEQVDRGLTQWRGDRATEDDISLLAIDRLDGGHAGHD